MSGLVALYVIQHIPRPLVDIVTARMAGALVPGGLLLFPFQIGEGGRVEVEPTGDYHIVMWSREEMGAIISPPWTGGCMGKDPEWPASMLVDAGRAAGARWEQIGKTTARASC